MYKRISNYLLENHPLFWLTRFWQMLFIGLLLWLVAYLTAYSMVSIESLKDEAVKYSYFRNFFSFHLVIGSIIYLIWALLFFRNNPLDQIYPLKKWYFQKLFLQIFIPAFLICSLYYPFTLGSIHKAKSLIDKTEMDKSAKQLAMGYPFLVMDRGMYKLRDRVYPAPFPCNSFFKNGNDEEWESSNNPFYQPPKADSQINTRTGAYTPIKQDPILYLDPNYYLFYHSHPYTYPLDTCNDNTIEVIDSFLIPHSNLVLKNRHLLNFHSVYLFENFNSASGAYEQDYYIKNIAPKVFHWVQHHQSDSIANALNYYNVFCKKFKININVDANAYAAKLDSMQYEAKFNLTKNAPDAFSSSTEAAVEVTEEAVLSKPDENYDPAEKSAPIGFVYFSAINTLFENNSFISDWYFDSDVIMAVFILVLVFTFLMLIAFGTNLIAIVISFVVGGIIISIIGLFIAFALGSTESIVLYTTFVLFSLFFLIQGYYMLYNSKWNKLVKTVSILLSLYAVPIFISSAYAWLYEMSAYTTIRCGQTDYHHSIMVIPWLGIMVTFIIIFFYVSILKLLKAKAED